MFNTVSNRLFITCICCGFFAFLTLYFLLFSLLHFFCRNIIFRLFWPMFCCRSYAKCPQCGINANIPFSSNDISELKEIHSDIKTWKKKTCHLCYRCTIINTECVPNKKSLLSATCRCYITNHTVKMVTTMGVFSLVFVFNGTMLAVTVRRFVSLSRNKEVSGKVPTFCLKYRWMCSTFFTRGSFSVPVWTSGLF